MPSFYGTLKLIAQETITGSGSLTAIGASGGFHGSPSGSTQWGAVANASVNALYSINPSTLVGSYLISVGISAGGLGLTNSSVIAASSFAGSNQSVGGSTSLSESYSWSMDVDTYIVYQNSSKAGGLYWPYYGPAGGGGSHSSTDGREGIVVQFPRPGGTVTVTCGSVTSSVTIPSTAMNYPITYYGALMQCSGGGTLATTFSLAQSGSASATAVVVGQTIKGTTTGSRSYFGGLGSCSYDFNSGCAISFTANLNQQFEPGSVGSYVGLVEDQYAPSISFVTLDGVAYPNPLTISMSSGNVFGGNQTVNQSWTTATTYSLTNNNQSSWEGDLVGIQTGGNGWPGIGFQGPSLPNPPLTQSNGQTTESILQGLGCFVSMPNDTTNQATGDSSLVGRRLLTRLPVFDAMQFGCNDNFILNDCTSATNWTPTPDTSTGNIRFTVTTGPSEFAQLNCLINPALSPYYAWWYTNTARYLQVVVQSEDMDHQIITVALQNGIGMEVAIKSWQITTGLVGVDTTVLIDLLRPDSYNLVPNASWNPYYGSSGGLKGVDYQDTSYRFNADSQVDGLHWGMTQAQQLNMTFPANSGRYIFKGFSLSVQNPPTVTFMESEQQQISGSPVGYNFPFILAETDALKRSLEMPGSFHGSGSVSYNLISDLVTLIGKQNLWMCSPVTASQSLWYYSPFLTDIGGGGSTWDGSTAHSFVDFQLPALTTNATIKSQLRLDTIIAPPNQGSILMGSPGSGPTQMQIYEQVGGRVWGAVYDASGNPVNGQSVTLVEQPSGSSRGSATTASDGSYTTGTPYSRGGPAGPYGSAWQNLINAGNAQGSGYISTRHTLRNWPLVATPSASHPWIWTDEQTGYTSMSDLEASASGSTQDGWFYFSASGDPSGGWDYSNQITTTGDVAFLRHARDSRGIYYAVFSRGQSGTTSGPWTLWQSISYNNGKTWTAPTAMPITNGNYPHIWCGHDGSIVEAALVYNSGHSGDGTIQATFQGSGDENPSGVFTLQSNGTNLSVQDTPFGLALQQGDAGRWLLSVLISGESATSMWQGWNVFYNFGSGSGGFTRIT